MVAQVLGGLHTGRERPAVELFVDPRPEGKPTSAPGSATVTWPSEPQDAKTPPVVGWRRVHQVRQMRPLVQADGGGDLTICRNATVPSLHPGAARAGRCQQRQFLRGGAFDGGGDPFGGGHPDRSGEEVELAGDHRHRPARYRARPGEDGIRRGRWRLGRRPAHWRTSGSARTSTGVVSQLTNDPGVQGPRRAAGPALMRLTGRAYRRSSATCRGLPGYFA